jgi:hypothetical protein
MTIVVARVASHFTTALTQFVSTSASFYGLKRRSLLDWILTHNCHHCIILMPACKFFKMFQNDDVVISFEGPINMRQLLKLSLNLCIQVPISHNTCSHASSVGNSCPVASSNAAPYSSWSSQGDWPSNSVTNASR